MRRRLVDNIALSFANNQTAENHVQLTALVRATNVGVERATCRAMAHSLLIRLFNERSVAEKKAKIEDETKREKVRRTKGKERLAGYADYFDTFNEEVKKAEQAHDYDETFKSLTEDVLNKTRKHEDKKRLEDFKKAAEGPRRVTATESTSEDIHVTSAIGGKITISFLRKGMAGHYEITLKEIEARSIQSEQDVRQMSKWADVKGLISTHEWRRLTDANPESTKDLLPEQVKEFVPVHEDMKALLEEHSNWKAEKRKKR